MLVAIPRLPGYARFSSTHNKWRLLEGTCALGEIIGEGARALGALLEQPDLDGATAWVAGQGVGGLAVLILGALDARVAGVTLNAFGVRGLRHSLSRHILTSFCLSPVDFLPVKYLPAGA